MQDPRTRVYGKHCAYCVDNNTTLRDMEETPEHVLLDCPKVREIWEWVEDLVISIDPILFFPFGAREKLYGFKPHFTNKNKTHLANYVVIMAQCAIILTRGDYNRGKKDSKPKVKMKHLLNSYLIK